MNVNKHWPTLNGYHAGTEGTGKPKSSVRTARHRAGVPVVHPNLRAGGHAPDSDGSKSPGRVGCITPLAEVAVENHYVRPTLNHAGRLNVKPPTPRCGSCAH